MLHRKRAIDAKRLRNYAVILLLALLVVALLGCLDKPKELQDTVNVEVYEDMGGKGDPQEQIAEFYDIALQGGEPVITPLAQYAIELDSQTGEIVGIYDSDGKSVSDEKAHELQVKYAGGDIITDAAQIDLHIRPIGENKYEILNLAREMPAEDGKVWKVSHDIENKYGGDTEFNDDIIKIGDHDDMYGGFVRGDDGKPYGVIVVDKDTFDQYGGNFGIKAKGDNAAHGIMKKDCLCLVDDNIYIYICELPEKSATVESLFPIDKDVDIAEKNGGYARFRFIKE